MKENPSFEKAKEVMERRDPYLGIILEEVRDLQKTLVEGHNVLEAKIDRVDANLESFKTEANEKFDMLFDGQKVLESGMKQLLGDNQEFFEELRNVEKAVGYRV